MRHELNALTPPLPRKGREIVFFFALAFCCTACTAKVTSIPAPAINSAIPAAATVRRYEPFELTVDLRVQYANPYDARQVALDVVFTGPDGHIWKAPGFWDTDKAWRVRFTPDLAGDWLYSLVVHRGQTASQPLAGKFTVTPSDLHGWLQVASWVNPAYSPRYLAYQDGTPFYGLGHCEAFTALSDGYDPVKGVALFDAMRRSGENMLVYWPIYSNPFFNSSYDSYSLPDLKVIDLVVEEARRKGIFIVFTVWDHGELRDKTHPWGNGLWEIQNGFRKLGDINSFFTSDEAWAWQQNLYRYIMARWGYSSSIGLWQTVSEIDGTNAGVHTDAWHAQVNDYFVKNDPYRHPTTASMAGDEWWPAGYQVMDVSQVHAYQYQNDPVYMGPSIAAWTQKMWEAESKPNFIGEFGTSNSANNPELLHNGLWAGLTSGAAATPMEWNDNSQWGRMTPDMYAQMAHLAYFVSELPLARLNPALLDVQVGGTAGTAAWGIGGMDWGVVWVQDITGAGYPIETVRKFIAAPLSGVSVTIRGLQAGVYLVKPYNTWQGVYLPTMDAASDGTSLTVNLPDFKSDLALKLERR